MADVSRCADFQLEGLPQDNVALNFAIWNSEIIANFGLSLEAVALQCGISQCQPCISNSVFSLHPCKPKRTSKPSPGMKLQWEMWRTRLCRSTALLARKPLGPNMTEQQPVHQTSWHFFSPGPSYLKALPRQCQGPARRLKPPAPSNGCQVTAAFSK